MTPSLVALHGFTGRPSAWRSVTRLLPADVHFVTPVLVGHGDPPVAMQDVHAFEDEVDRLATLVSSEPRPIHLAGYSLGARLALGLLVRHPALFASATLIGAQAGLPTEESRRERLDADDALVRLLTDHGLAAFVDHWESLPLFGTQRELPEPLCAARRKERLSHTASGLAHSLKATGLGAMPSYRDALASLEISTTWVAGSRDEKFTSIARSLAKLSPNGSVEIVPGAGHDVVLESPAAVARLLALALRARP